MALSLVTDFLGVFSKLLSPFVVCNCGYRLVIEKANYSHAGVYTCRASNRFSVIESNMTVLVGGRLASLNFLCFVQLLTIDCKYRDYTELQ